MGSGQPAYKIFSPERCAMSRSTDARLPLRSTLEIVLMLAILVLIYAFFFTSAGIAEDNMNPTLRAGQQVLISRLPYRLAEPRRGDIVAVSSGQNPAVIRLYRVIGLPYERVTVRSGQVTINGRLLQEAYLLDPRPRFTQDATGDGDYRVGPNTYLLLNDNRVDRSDSRSFGLVPRDALIGRAWIIYWPPESIGFIPHQRPALGGP